MSLNKIWCQANFFEFILHSRGMAFYTLFFHIVFYVLHAKTSLIHTSMRDFFSRWKNIICNSMACGQDAIARWTSGQGKMPDTFPKRFHPSRNNVLPSRDDIKETIMTRKQSGDKIRRWRKRQRAQKQRDQGRFQGNQWHTVYKFFYQIRLSCRRLGRLGSDRKLNHDSIS